MNKVILIGNLTRDPELNTTNSGAVVCRFGLAVQRPFSSSSDNGNQVDFFNITVWNKQGENCHKFLKKGSKCCVVGRLQNSTYEANDGTKRTSTDVVANEVEFIGSRNNDQSGESVPANNKGGVSELQPIDDDSLPF